MVGGCWVKSCLICLAQLGLDEKIETGECIGTGFKSRGSALWPQRQYFHLHSLISIVFLSDSRKSIIRKFLKIKRTKEIEIYEAKTGLKLHKYSRCAYMHAKL